MQKTPAFPRLRAAVQVQRSRWTRLWGEIRKDRLTDDPRGFPKQAELEHGPTYTPLGLNLKKYYRGESTQLKPHGNDKRPHPGGVTATLLRS